MEDFKQSDLDIVDQNLLKAILLRYNVRCASLVLETVDENFELDSTILEAINPSKAIVEGLEPFLLASKHSCFRATDSQGITVKNNRFDMRVAPIIDSAVYFRKEEFSGSSELSVLSFRLISGSVKSNILECVRNSRRITMRNISKWCLQLLSTISFWHTEFISGVEFSASDICLVADEHMCRSIEYYRRLGINGSKIGSKVIEGAKQQRRSHSRDAWFSPIRIIKEILSSPAPSIPTTAGTSKGESSRKPQPTHRLSHLVSYRDLQKHLVSGSNGIVHFSADDVEAETTRRRFGEFHQGVHRDLRQLGLVALELVMVTPIPSPMRATMLMPSFSLKSSGYFDASSQPRPIVDLLDLCLEPFIPARESALQPEKSSRGAVTVELNSTYVHAAKGVIQGLAALLDSLGGEHVAVVSSGASVADEQGLSDERVQQLAEKAVVGREAARRRLWRHRKQVEFELLPEEEQDRILRRQEARRQAIDRSRRRAKLIHAALFHYWTESERRKWVYQAVVAYLTSCVEVCNRNYSVDKSLLQRAEAAVGTVDRVQGRLQLVAGVAMGERSASASANGRERPGSREAEGDADGDRLVLFKAIARYLAQFFSQRSSGLELNKWLSEALKDAQAKLQSNALSRVLPEAQYKLLREKTQASILGRNRVLYGVAVEVATLLDFEDEQWREEVILLLAMSMALRYEADEKDRAAGTNYAAARVQALLRRTRVRVIVRRIWREADRLLDEELAQQGMADLAAMHGSRSHSLVPPEQLQTQTANDSRKESRAGSYSVQASADATVASVTKDVKAVKDTRRSRAGEAPASRDPQGDLSHVSQRSKKEAPTVSSAPPLPNIAPPAIPIAVGMPDESPAEGPPSASKAKAVSRTEGLRAVTLSSRSAELSLGLFLTEFGLIQRRGIRARARITVLPHRSAELAGEGHLPKSNRFIVLGGGRGRGRGRGEQQRDGRNSAENKGDDGPSSRSSANTSLGAVVGQGRGQLGVGAVVIVLDTRGVGMGLPLPEGTDCDTDFSWDGYPEEETDNRLDDDDSSRETATTGVSLLPALLKRKDSSSTITSAESLNLPSLDFLSSLPQLTPGAKVKPTPFSTASYEANRSLPRTQLLKDSEKTIPLPPKKKTSKKNPHQTCTINLKGLSPFCTYTVSVIAHNLLVDVTGASADSLTEAERRERTQAIFSRKNVEAVSVAVTSVSTSEAVPERPENLSFDHMTRDMAPKDPDDSRAELRRHHVLHLMWECPLSNGSPVIEFQIQRRLILARRRHKSVEPESTDWTTVGNTADVGFTDVVDPQSSSSSKGAVTALEYRVRARNKLGWSKSSTATLINLSGSEGERPSTTGAIDETGSRPGSAAAVLSVVRTPRPPSAYSMEPQLSSLLLTNKYADMLCESPSSSILYGSRPSTSMSFRQQMVNSSAESRNALAEVADGHDGSAQGAETIDNDMEATDSGVVAGDGKPELSLEEWLARLAEASPIGATVVTSTRENPKSLHHNPASNSSTNGAIPPTPILGAVLATSKDRSKGNRRSARDQAQLKLSTVEDLREMLHR